MACSHWSYLCNIQILRGEPIAKFYQFGSFHSPPKKPLHQKRNCRNSRRIQLTSTSIKRSDFMCPDQKQAAVSCAYPFSSFQVAQFQFIKKSKFLLTNAVFKYKNLKQEAEKGNCHFLSIDGSLFKSPIVLLFCHPQTCRAP